MKKNIFCFLRMFLLHSFIMIGLISYNAIELPAQPPPCPNNVLPKSIWVCVDSLESKNIAQKDDKHLNDQVLSLNKYNDIILEQNNPNPFAETSTINYYVPNEYNGLISLIISDEKGLNILSSYELIKGRPNQLKISSKNLSTGVYLYGIMLNSSLIKTQKMIVIR